MTHSTPAHRAAVYRREADLLFRAWKEKHARTGLDHTAGVFVRDGVVCPAQWFAQPVRPLFLLKEAYHGSRDWDLVQDHLLPMDRVRGRTWNRVALWTYGLLHTTAGRLCPFAEAAAETGDTLLRAIAVMNVKKRSGRTRSHMAEIRRYAAADRAELYRQLQLCDPTVLVCGYTISALGHILPGPPLKDPDDPAGHNPDLFYFCRLNGHPLLVLDYWHPANHFPDLMNYYGLLGIYQQALAAGP